MGQIRQYISKLAFFEMIMSIKPPASTSVEVLKIIQKITQGELSDDYLSCQQPLDSKGRYLPYAEFRYRVKAGLDAEIAWMLTRITRQNMSSPVIALGEPPEECRLFLTPGMQQSISQVDQHTTEPMLHWINSQIGERRNLEFLFSDLVEDESISSSQLEGAATTTKVAKEMLKRKRQPRSLDERMILGNFRMMQFVWEKRHQSLDNDLIRELHHCGVQGIDDGKYHPGQLRTTNEVVVVDQDGDVVHHPPSHKGLEQRLQLLCDWVNSEGDINGQYLHPLVKACVLHFAIGFEHPFHDGNGRVARALFYWFMFKHGFIAFRYISISHLLKQAHVQYGKSYLYTETDKMDLTYFVEYQCQIVQRAIQRFVETYKAAIQSLEEFDSFLYQSGLYGKLTDRARTIFQVARAGVEHTFTISDSARNLGCSYNTAAAALNDLVKLGLFSKDKEGRGWVYQMVEPGQIMRDWK